MPRASIWKKKTPKKQTNKQTIKQAGYSEASLCNQVKRVSVEAQHFHCHL
ncbi:rCG62906 [Rattus norvegicus]|uniref:RCG62906 n=1 Tax=Rattus norvegicus TaxID=10116 RepID=A6J2L9_RAT|nr:rCG62906 [Rattus norvegicus]